MKKIIFTFLSLCYLSASFYAQNQPNIMLIIADDLGNDALEGFGIEPKVKRRELYEHLGHSSVYTYESQYHEW